MEESLQSRVEHLGGQIKRLCEHLATAGYVFQYPDEVFPGPEADAVLAISRIEREVGEVPLALKLFWLHVGSVNLCGAHPKLSDCEYPDPLVVYPPSVALSELDEFREEPEGLLLIPIAPDDFHKADVSGGMFYNVSVPAAEEDPPLQELLPVKHTSASCLQQTGSLVANRNSTRVLPALDKADSRAGSEAPSPCTSSYRQ